MKKGVIVKDIKCELCNKKEEISDHLFLTYKASKRIWQLCDRWMETRSVHHNKSMLNFQHLYSMDLNAKQNTTW